jgi:vitamin B12 transporter
MRIILKSVIALALAAPALAHAEESGDLTSPSDAGNPDIVVTASRVTQEAREIGSSVTVVTQQDIQRGQINFAKDILQDVPGVVISSDRAGDLTNISIRGSNNDEVLWLIDGIELGDPSSVSTQFQAGNLTTRDIARMEVLRGNQSSLYGSDAIGGVINVITQRAAEDGYHVNAELEGGSYGTVNGGASLLGKSGPLDFRITGTGYRQGGPSLADPATANPPGSVTEDDQYWHYGVSGRIGFQATDTLSFQTTGFWMDSHMDLDNTTSDSSDFVRTQEWAVGGQGSYASTDGKLRVNLTASRYVADRRYFGQYNSPDGDLYDGTRDKLSLGVFYGGQGVISLAAGGDYEHEEAKETTLYSGDFLEKIHTGSAYGELALRPLAGMTITGAGRYDDNSRFGSFWTYRGTFAYAIGAAKFRASYGTGAKAPGLYQLFDPTYGNPNLKPETSRGGDVGLDFTFAEGLTGQLTYFFNHKRDEINFDGTLPPFGGYNQFGRTRAKGVEVAITARPLPWLTLSQTYTYTDHEVDNALPGEPDTGYVESGRPRYSGTTTVTVVPVARAELTARMRFRDGDSSGYGGVTQPYTVVDLLGSYGITDRIELYGRVVNLFDKHYQMTYGTQTLGLSAFGGVRASF